MVNCSSRRNREMDQTVVSSPLPLQWQLVMDRILKNLHLQDAASPVWLLTRPANATLSSNPSTSTTPPNLQNRETVQVYCRCRLQEGPMTLCEGCDTWFHKTCENIPKSAWEKDSKWFYLYELGLHYTSSPCSLHCVDNCTLLHSNCIILL